jgi:hypothetical protein
MLRPDSAPSKRSNQASATLVSNRSNQASATLVSNRSNQASATLVGGTRHSGLAPAVAALAKGDTAPTFSRVLTYSSVIAGLSGALPEAPKQPPPAGPTTQGEEEQSVEDEEIRKGGKARKSREGKAGPERIEVQQGFMPVRLVDRNAARVAISSNDGCSMSIYVPFEGGVDDWKPIVHRIAKWGGVKLINMKNVLAKTPLVFSTPTACKAMSLSLDGQVTLKAQSQNPSRVFDPDCLQGHVPEPRRPSGGQIALHPLLDKTCLRIFTFSFDLLGRPCAACPRLEWLRLGR